MSQSIGVQVEGDLALQIESWKKHLRASKSAKTIDTYMEAAGQLAAFLAQAGMSTDVTAIKREHVEAFIENLRARFKPATANNRYRALRQLFAWLQEEGEVTESPMARMEPPPLEEKPIPVPTDDLLLKLLKACKGDMMEDRRDTAIISVFVDLGLRLRELSNLRLEDYDREEDTILVTRKGRRGRIISQQLKLGAEAAKALDRYMRRRPNRRGDDGEWLWLSKKGPLGASGVYQMLKRRCRQAGIEEINPHRLRHYFAHSWLMKGGNAGDLQWLAGWRSPAMLNRYAQATQGARAQAAHERNSPLDHLKGRH